MITDFAPQSDRIDLTGIDADATQAGNQAFTWVGSEALTAPGQLGYSVADGDVIVRGSTDADAAPEFAIQLSALTGIGGYAFFL